MVVVVSGVTPAYGTASKAITLEITGSGFTVSSVPSLVSPTSPPITYALTEVTFVNSGMLRATAAAGSIPLGFYDVKVDNGGGVTGVLPQSYRASVDLLDLYADQTTPTIISRIINRFSNAPNGKPYDLRTGSVVNDLATAPAPELSLLWERMSRVVKLGFAQYMGGIMLRLRGEEHGVIAKPFVFATGVIKTTAPLGTILPTNMTFSTTAVANSGISSLTFTSTEPAQKIEKTTVTGNVTAADPTSITDNTKNFVVNEWQNHYVWITGGTGTNQLHKIVSNTATKIVISGWDTGTQPDTTSLYQLFSGVDVRADLPGVIGNVATGAINLLTSGTSFVTAVTNPIAFINGLDAETDAQFLARYLLSVRSPSSGGNITDYQRWAKETPNVNIGQVSVISLWNGNGTVKIVVINSDNTIPSAATIGAIQQYVDPNAAGQGGGKAPIGAQVTVVAATPVAIDFAVALTIASGFNGALIRSAVQTAITNYINNLPVGQSIIFTQLQYVILSDSTQVTGERAGIQDYDVQSAGHGVKLSSSNIWTQANVVLTGAQKATVGTVTVT